VTRETASSSNSQPASEILIYQPEDGKTRIDVRLEDGTVWLTQMQMVDLFQSSKQNISLHIRNIYEERELSEDATVKEYLTVQTEGQRRVQRAIKYYNLDVIIAVGYRVRSHRGTQFRRWATERLREYLVKGFAMDDERLKEGRNFGADYFDELLDRIRDIRASEKQFYRKITQIYALSADYDPEAEITLEFFASVQNKLHWAIHHHTAAELIAERADADKPNMGLTSWKGAKVRKADVATAKNYLTEDEVRALNRIVTMYLDYAEDQAQRQQPMYMHDWTAKLDAFLQFNGREALDNPGSVSAEVARRLAQAEYVKFSARRLQIEAEDPIGDFDKAAKRIVRREKGKGAG
jgi:hypothetical protein